MRNDVLMYKKAYQILKKRIECGLLPNGVSLPSRANLSKEFGVSEKTIRHAVDLLAAEGLLETRQRKRPVVTYSLSRQRKENPLLLQKADKDTANNILKTGILLCYPIIQKGLSICKGEEEWSIPETILENMDPHKAHEFWQLNNRIWQFFIARTGNELILYTLSNLGLSELDPLPVSFKSRSDYLKKLKRFLKIIKHGGDPYHTPFKDLPYLYDCRQVAPSILVTPNSTLWIDVNRLEHYLSETTERYSSVYLDLLALITFGHYLPGDRLPSHSKLRETYGVSVDTIVKAIKILRNWGVVTTKPGKGIFVAMDAQSLKTLPINPNVIARHVRRYLDSLEFLSLTLERVAAHAGSRAVPEEVEKLRDNISSLWNSNCCYRHQFPTIMILNFIVDHIQFEALKAIYEMIRKNYLLGNNIPQLVKQEKTSHESYQQSLEAIEILAQGNPITFAKKTAKMFQQARQLVIAEIKNLGYWEAAMQVYDGTSLWK